MSMVIKKRINKEKKENRATKNKPFESDVSKERKERIKLVKRIVDSIIGNVKWNARGVLAITLLQGFSIIDLSQEEFGSFIASIVGIVGLVALATRIIPKDE